MFWKILIASVIVFGIYTSCDCIDIVMEEFNLKNETLFRVIVYILWVFAFMFVADMWILFCV